MNGEINDTTSFHLQLLSKVIDMQQYPMIKLMIENNITEAEFNQLLQLLADLNEKFEIQKEEGLLDFTPLLIHFAGMLNEKLDPDTTILALKKEGHYPSLMNAFIEVLNESKESELRR
ncbi:DUF1878 family protein [Virgibacillus siamensis]|uniref:DUF1878 family protein n=1 Tax=Virgibacillus siamensis TaxID=480071 RepID=UPI000987A668|nr:DUF1878 family protein [Virgibacillus siamensis]